LIENVGWRNAWIVMGLVVGLFILPVWWLLMRNSPENYGLAPDSPRVQARAAETLDAEDNWTLSEALHTPIFWVFLFGRVTAAAIGTALVFHQISIFGVLGHSREAVAANFGTMALVNAFPTLVLGRVFNRMRPGLIMALQLVLMMVTVWLAMHATSTQALLIYAATFGVVFSLGGVFDLSVWADLFGRLHHGAIRGFSGTAHVIGTASGPVIFGAAFDYFDSYEPIMWASIAVTVLPLVASLLVNRPRKRLETPLAA
jgi:sugar phosphate permease